jgi:hypothetical protein
VATAADFGLKVGDRENAYPEDARRMSPVQNMGQTVVVDDTRGGHMRWYRATGVVLAGLVALAAAGGFARATNAQPFFGGPHYIVERGSSLVVNFGAKGTAAAEIIELSITAPSYPGLTITPEQAGCEAESELVVHCPGPMTYGTLPGVVRVHTTDATPLGYAGVFTAATPDGSVTAPVWVTSAQAGADLEVRPADVIARVGEVVPMTVTVTNHGPSPEPYWGITNLNLRGAQLVGQHGCSPGELGGMAWQCLDTDVTAAGATVVVTFDVKILQKPTYGQQFGFSMVEYLKDPNPNNLTVYARVLDGSGSGSGGTGGTGDSASSGGTSDSGGAVPDASPAPSASPADSVVPSALPAGSPTGPTLDTVARRPVSSTPWYLGGAFVLVLAGIGLLARRRWRLGAADGDGGGGGRALDSDSASSTGPEPENTPQ